MCGLSRMGEVTRTKDQHLESRGRRAVGRAPTLQAESPSLLKTKAEIRDADDRDPGDLAGPVEWRPVEKDGVEYSRARLPFASAWILEVSGRFEWLAFRDGVPVPVGLGKSPSVDLAQVSAEAAMRPHHGVARD